MAFSVSVLTSASSSSDLTDYASGTVTPTANRLLVICGSVTRSTSDTETPTITGWGYTWTNMGQVTVVSGGSVNRRLFCHAALTGASPSSGNANANFANTASSCDYYVLEIHGANLGRGVPGVFRDQTGSSVYLVSGVSNTNGTSITATLASAVNANNRGFAWGCINQNTPTDISPNTNWTEIGSQLAHNNPAATIEAQWRSDAFDTSVSMSWGANSTGRGIAAFELYALLNQTIKVNTVGF